MQNKLKYLLALTILLWTGIAAAQTGEKSHKRYTEAEISAEADFIEAESAFILGKQDDARQKFEDFIKQHPDVPMAYYQLARIYDAQNDTRRAILNVSKAVKLDPENKWFVIAKAELLEKDNRPLEAAQTMQQLTRFHPNDDLGYKKAAYYFLLAQKPHEALDILDKALQVIGPDPEIFYRQHVIYLSLGQPKKAIEALRKIIHHNPKATEHRLQLAEIYVNEGKYDLAEKEYRYILSYDPHNAAALLGLQKRKPSGNKSPDDILTLVQDPATSIDLKIAEIVPLIREASPDLPQDKKDSHVRLIRALLQAHPGHPKATATAADMYFALGDTGQALDYYIQTLQKEKSVYPVWQQAIQLLFVNKRYDDVIAKTTEALDFFPNKLQLYLFLAEAQFRSGQAQSAADNYRQAALMAGKNKDRKRFALAKLAEVYIKLGNLQKAQQYLDKANALSGSSDPFVEHVAQEVRQGRLSPPDPKWATRHRFAILIL